MALLRSAATVGGYTMASRVLGFVRDILTAAFLGAGPVADAFFVAQRLPNLFRSLFAEGAFSAAFVPLFAGTIAQDGKTVAKRFAEDSLSVLLTALFIFVLFGEIFTPNLLDILAPGFRAQPEKFALTVGLTRITFPYLLFISLTALQGGILNSVERFAATAATPMLLNVFLIGALVLVRPISGQALAWALSASGFAQFVWLMFSCHKAGLSLSLPWPRLTPEVKRMLKLMLPGVFGAGVTQLNLVVSTAVASMLPTGAVSYLYYADRLNQLPLAVVGIAVGTAILPALSRQVRLGDNEGAKTTQNRGLELALFLTLPSAVGLGVAAWPIMSVLFERGAFGPVAANATAAALAAYAAGLPAFVLIKIMTPGFFARHDTATPVKVAIVAMITNLVLTVFLGLVLPFGHVGNASATSIAGWVNALSLMVLLHRRGHFTLDARSRRIVPRIVAASAGMGMLLWLMDRFAAPLYAGPFLARSAALILVIGIAVMAFFVLALVFGAADWREIKRRAAMFARPRSRQA
ncbi:MAG TPA: murein biosynthesis integral membrane protein MurJ [Stellaceae bacterium]|nr:murein biosynthesis integral membrane protein MurJ [Stellaceae bacterium]